MPHVVKPSKNVSFDGALTRLRKVHQTPRRKNVLIDYERLRNLIGAKSYDHLSASHRGRGNTLELGQRTVKTNGPPVSLWEGGPLLRRWRALLGLRAKGRDIVEGDGGYQLREGAGYYKAVFEPEKDDTGAENAYFWESKVR